MAQVPSGSREHRIVQDPHRPDEFTLYWTVYNKHGRILYPRSYSRETDRKGAERFAKKWGIKMPSTEKRDTTGWTPILPVTMPCCDICDRMADWQHPAGGFRCSRCPRP